MTHRKRQRTRFAGLLAVIAAIAVWVGYGSASSTDAAHDAPVRAVWPAEGQAAYVRAGQRIHVGPNQHRAPIASIAKVMTAYLVLRDHPLRVGQDGPTITLTDADVADTDRRRRQEESVVPVSAGERLSERQALQALLLPSANNIAAALARWDAGSEARFVARMNATARTLGMTHTQYTDPSGYDDATVSTAADQVRIVLRAMRLPAFASIVATPSATLPVAGIVHNTNTLLGRGGFVGVKTGSDAAAGGCFAFRAIRRLDGKRTTITGVVLGQPGRDRIEAGLMAAAGLVDRVAGPLLPGSLPMRCQGNCGDHAQPGSVPPARREGRRGRPRGGLRVRRLRSRGAGRHDARRRPRLPPPADRDRAARRGLLRQRDLGAALPRSPGQGAEARARE
jgi:D-alanyl-D-alanine carboxypeptidase (penicillin-binding protein 5/6)